MLGKLLAFTLLALQICGPCSGAPTESARPILIVQPLTDQANPNDYARDYYLGAKVYFDQLNAENGIRGRKIAFKRQAINSGSTYENSAEKPDILFGVVGDDMVSRVNAIPSVRSGHLPLFGVVDSAGRNQDAAFVLRTALSDELSGILEQLKNFGINRFAIVYAPNTDTRALTRASESAQQLGIKITLSVAMTERAEAIQQTVTQVHQTRPQAVIVISDTLAAGGFFKNYRKLDPGTFLCAPSMVNPKTVIETIGQRAARGLVVSQVVPSANGSSELAREHRKLMSKFADEPHSSATLEGYIAAKAMAFALQNAQDWTAKGMRQALNSQGMLRFGGYDLNFSSGRPASRFVELNVVSQNGELAR